MHSCCWSCKEKPHEVDQQLHSSYIVSIKQKNYHAYSILNILYALFVEYTVRSCTMCSYSNKP